MSRALTSGLVPVALAVEFALVLRARPVPNLPAKEDGQPTDSGKSQAWFSRWPARILANFYAIAADLDAQVAALCVRSTSGAGGYDRGGKQGDMLPGDHRPDFEPMVCQHECHINL